MKVKTMLTIAGSDSSGGAGVQADCAVARAFNVFPVCAVSCVTSQGSRGLRMIAPVELSLFEDQIRVALEDFRPEAVKIGMIPSEIHAIKLIELLYEYHPVNVVLDPVASPSQVAGISSYPSFFKWNKDLLKDISPLLTLLTPNLPEATELSGVTSNKRDMAIELIEEFDLKALLLKGGHSESTPYYKDYVTDILAVKDRQLMEFKHPRIVTPNTHGTGCALSSMIASNLCHGIELKDAVGFAINSLSISLADNKDLKFYGKTEGGNIPKGPAFFQCDRNFM